MGAGEGLILVPVMYAQIDDVYGTLTEYAMITQVTEGKVSTTN